MAEKIWKVVGEGSVPLTLQRVRADTFREGAVGLAFTVSLSAFKTRLAYPPPSSEKSRIWGP